MAGTIIADYIRTDANKLSLNVGNVTFATINSSGFFSNTGVQIIDQNGVVTLFDGQVTTSKIADAAITNAKLSLSANDSNIKTALNASGNPGIFAARAWVNFNGTGTVAIRGSGNVSSITDNGAGDYTVNFTTAMPDTNYAASTKAGILDMSLGYFWIDAAQVFATGSYRFATGRDGGVARFDSPAISVAIFR